MCYEYSITTLYCLVLKRKSARSYLRWYVAVVCHQMSPVLIIGGYYGTQGMTYELDSRASHKTVDLLNDPEFAKEQVRLQ